MREKEALDQNKNKYKGLVIDAHVLETFPKSIATFLAELDVPYIVDPITYRFTLDNIFEHANKKWYGSLETRYGLRRLLTSGVKIERSDLERPNILRNIVARVLKYQQRRLSVQIRNAMGLLAFFGEQVPTRKQTSPEILIPPYFLISNPKWVDLNVKATLQGLEMKKNDEKLYAVIPVEKDVFLFESQREYIIEKYSQMPVDGFMLWITNLRESSEDSALLKDVINFCRNLKQKSSDKPIINLYGSYFSLILMSKGIIDSAVQGLGITESRDPYAESGPVPPRYYVPLLHNLFPPKMADNLAGLHNMFRCNCAVCTNYSLISDMSIQDMLNHLILIRKEEIEEITSKSVSEIIDELKKIRANVMKIGRQKGQSLGMISKHLGNWASALKALES